MSDILAVAHQFTVLTDEGKEISSELKEIKAQLMEYFEQHSEVDQIGKVKCQRTPKKAPLNSKKVLEIVEDEILKAPASSSGGSLMENITTRVKASEAPGDIQLKLSVASDKKPRKKANVSS